MGRTQHKLRQGAVYGSWPERNSLLFSPQTTIELTTSDFARLSLAAGAVAVILIDVGDMIWWQETIAWKIWPLVYNFTAFVIAGHLLGILMKEKAPDAG